MKLNSPLFSFLARTKPGNIINDQSEPSTIEVPPMVLASGRVPFPITAVVGLLETLPAGQAVSGSFMASRDDVLNAVPGNVNWIFFPEGLWDVELQHFVFIQGAVSDPTATIQSTLTWADVSNPVKSMALTAVTGGQTVYQRLYRRFPLLVTKDVSIRITITGSAGLGTSSNTSRLSLTASRSL